MVCYILTVAAVQFIGFLISRLVNYEISDSRLDDVFDPVPRSILVRLADRSAYHWTAYPVTGPRGPDGAKRRSGATWSLKAEGANLSLPHQCHWRLSETSSSSPILRFGTPPTMSAGSPSAGSFALLVSQMYCGSGPLRLTSARAGRRLMKGMRSTN